jgi:hypothetical protein
MHGGLKQIHLEAWRTGGYPSSNYSSIKRSSCGLQRQIRLSLSSRISYLAQLKDFLSKPPVLTAPHKKE